MSTTARPGGASYTPPDTKKFQMPNDEQWRIVKNCDDHLLVAAGAGTGKTSTVIYKILHLLGVQLLGETHPSPLQLSDIAAITYTNHAAAEIKDKLRTALRAVGRRADAYRVDSARVGTIHSFCGDVLREFALRAQHPPGMTLIDEAEGEVLRFECIRDVLITALEARMPDAKGREADLVSGLDALIADWEIKQIEGWVGELVRQGDHLRVLAERSATYGESERALVTMAVRAKALMEKRLFAAEQMDFDRMIEWTRDLIRDDPTVRRSRAARDCVSPRRPRKPPHRYDASHARRRSEAEHLPLPSRRRARVAVR
jgi:superfamily I DNA/RNA helicase